MDAVVFSGGGARGAYLTGALTAANESGLFKDGFQVACGTSVGAITAAALAHYPAPMWTSGLDNLIRVWKTLGTASIFRKRSPFGLPALWNPSLGDASAIRALLAKEVFPDQIRASGVKLRMPAVDLESGRLVVFNEQTKDLRGAVYASASFPAVFEPGVVEGEGKWFTDGGVREVAPLRHAIKAGADRILLVTCSHPFEPTREEMKGKNTLDVAMRCSELMVNEIIRNDIEMCEERSHTRRPIELVKVFPTESLGDQLDFSSSLTQARQKQGYDDAMRAFAVVAKR